MSSSSRASEEALYSRTSLLSWLFIYLLTKSPNNIGQSPTWDLHATRCKGCRTLARDGMELSLAVADFMQLGPRLDTLEFLKITVNDNTVRVSSGA
jgi:hypothetical protein